MTDILDWTEFAAPADGDYPEPFKFATAGDAIAGTITRIRRAEIDGKVMPELYIQPDDGEERSVLCGQVRLKLKLAELRPGTGDRIAIKFTGTEPGKKPGHTIKVFEVAHKRGDVAPESASADNAPAAPSAADLI